MMNNQHVPGEMTVDQAVEALRNRITIPRKTSVVSPSDALNQLLAEDVIARRDVPAFDNSAMDGFVFRKEDLDTGRRKFPLSAEIRPENMKPRELDPETCARIMTGAPVPQNGTQVVPVEMIHESGDEVEILDLPKRNPIRKRGEGYARGQTLLAKNSVIRPYETGLIIESGNTDCKIRTPLRIALQVTGSEIDETSDTNGPVIEGLLKHWPGVEVKRWPVLEDHPEKVTQRMKQLASSADIVLTTGGISAGKHDYLLRSMNGIGAEVLIRKVKQKPGKPLKVTLYEGVPFIHLPGNPVSAVFCAEYYVRALVFNLLDLPFPEFDGKITADTENHRREKTLFLPGKLEYDRDGRRTVTVQSDMRSHLMQLYTRGDVYIRLEPGSRYLTGDKVKIFPFSYQL
jgi:molybdopterin molybdotransferase